MPHAIMTPKHTNPSDDDRSNANPLPPTDGIYDDAALRLEIARLMDEPPDQPIPDEHERQARIEALRARINGGDYMSDEMIGEIVDRLLRKWKL